MSWNKEQFKKAYNRAKGKQEVDQDYPDYNNLYGYWDDWHDHCCDNCEASMGDIVTGKLFSILSKLKIRGSKDILDTINW